MDLVTTRPGELWRALADQFAENWVSILPDGYAPHPPAQSVLQQMAIEVGAGAALGRVRHAGGRVSRPLRRIASLESDCISPGALIFRAREASRFDPALFPQWDEHFCRDLALALARAVPLHFSRMVLATATSPIPQRCLPFERARPVSASPDAANTSAGSAHPVRVLVYGKAGASTSLYLSGLPADLNAAFRFLEPRGLKSDFDWLASADLVLVTRGFRHMLSSGALALLRDIGTPVVWFTDDDFVALGTEIPALAWYTPARIGAFAAGLAAIVVTSPNLMERFAKYHDTVLLAPLIADPRWFARRKGSGEHWPVAVVGGGFRSSSFTAHVLPAVTAAGRALIVTRDLAQKGMSGQVLPFEPDLAQFLYKWQAFAPGAVLHPYGDTLNIEAKSRGTIIVAAALGAVPVVGHEPAYAGLGEAEGVVVAERDPESWQQALVRIADPVQRTALARRLDAFIARTAAPEAARNWVTQVMGLAASANREGRYPRALASLRQRTPLARVRRRLARACCALRALFRAR